MTLGRCKKEIFIISQYNFHLTFKELVIMSLKKYIDIIKINIQNIFVSFERTTVKEIITI